MNQHSEAWLSRWSSLDREETSLSQSLQARCSSSSQADSRDVGLLSP
ncbi:hypothetical protein GTR02_08655 [Kineococcus sp. R8]|nr:hypothetical protein [Kineococcus siccus]NAZ81888.1 hypothetical protein [Kineococcus siccus]